MAMDPSLRPMLDAFNAVRDKAAKELLDLQKTYQGQARLLSDFLGQDVDGAANRLADLESRGMDAIPDGLRQDVLDAYNTLAQIIKDAPTELQPWVDRDGTQAVRADLTARASRLIEETAASREQIMNLMQDGENATGAGTLGGIGAIVGSFSAGWIAALVALGLITVGAAYWLYQRHAQQDTLEGLWGGRA